MRLRDTLPVVVTGQALNAALSFVFILLVSRWLGSSGKGAHAVLSASAQIGAVLLGFGYAGTVPFIVQGDPRRVEDAWATQAKLLLVALVASLGFGIANLKFGYDPSLAGAELPVILLLVGFIAQLFASSLALSVGDARSSVGASILGTVLAFLAVGVIRVHAGGVSAVTVILWQAVGQLGGAAWAVTRVVRRAPRRPTPPPSRAAPDRILRASAYGLASSVAATIMVRGDIFLVERFAGIDTAGVYSLAIFLVEIGAKVPQWMAQALTSVVSSDFEAGIDRTLSLTAGAVLIASLFFLAVLAFEPLLGRGLVAVAGRDFGATLPLIVALAPRVIVQAGLALVAGNLAAHGYTTYHPGGTILGLGAMIGADLILIPRFGGYGAAIGSTVGMVCSAGVIVIGFARVNGVGLGTLPARTARAFTAQVRAVGRSAGIA